MAPLLNRLPMLADCLLPALLLPTMAALAGGTVPDPPTLVGVSSGDQVIYVHVLPPANTGNAGPIYYNTFCYFISNGQPSGYVGVSFDTTITTTGQTNGAAVRCRATAVNDLGPSTATDYSENATPGLPPAAPAIEGMAPGNAQVTVSFSTASADPATPVLDYLVRCQPTMQEVTGSSSPIVVTGLANDVIHDCTVSARNVVGRGLPSEPAAVIPVTDPTADIGVSLSNQTRFVEGGSSTRYQLTVTNHGPAGAAGVQVITELDPNLLALAWSCTETGLARCTASGVGQLQQQVDLGAGTSVDFVIDALVPELPETPITSVAGALAPTGISDAAQGNNIASDGPDARGISNDGFE